MEADVAEAHLGQSLDLGACPSRSVLHQPGRAESTPSCHLPLLREPAHERANQHASGTYWRRDTVWKGEKGLCIRGLLHNRLDFHARVYHAAYHQADRAVVRDQEQGEAGEIYGAVLHGHLFCHLWAFWIVRDEQDTGLVLPHCGNVRGIPSQSARGCLQGILPPPGRILGAAGHCLDATA